MNNQVTLTWKVLVIGALILLGSGYLIGRWHQGIIYDRQPVTAETSYTPTTPPPPVETTNIPATTTPPRIVYRTRIDSSAKQEAQDLWQRTVVQQRLIDSLVADTSRLRRLLEDHYSQLPFKFNLTDDGRAFLDGQMYLGYSPTRETFNVRFSPTNLVMPMVTETRHYRPPWWQKPLTAIMAAGTVIAVQEKQVLPAIGTSVSTLVLIGVDF